MKYGEKAVKQDYIWNTVAGLLNAMESVIMSIFVTRITGLADAGILAVSFTIGNQMLTIGKFGLRSYQATDVRERFSFGIYLKSRMLTTLVMLISTLFYLLYGYACRDYKWNKAGAILAICLIYAVEAFEDVIWGYYQQRNRLYVGAQMFCGRWGCILAVFPFVLYLSRNLLFTLWICFGLSVLIFFVFLKLTFRKISGENTPVRMAREIEWKESGRLLKTTFPLFGISFLAFYVNSAPKYAIDACLSDEIQACYNFVAMPVFVIGLFNNFIYQPMLVPMAVEWEERQMKNFAGRIKKQLIVIAGISAVCILGAYVVGIPALSLLYHTDLAGYKRELLILLLSGGFIAASGYLSAALTIMRCQKSLLWPYCLIALIAFWGFKKVVGTAGTFGAAVYYLLLMAALCSLYGGLLFYKLKIMQK